jgi:regulator of nucleoside diphosphate kinase
MGLLTISDLDYRRLTGIADSELTYWQERQSLAQLRGELERAEIRPSAEMPDDVVSMNSLVQVRDLLTRETISFKLAYPHDADAELHKISVLSPLGMAVIGEKIGSVVEWEFESGKRRLKITAARLSAFDRPTCWWWTPRTWDSRPAPSPPSTRNRWAGLPITPTCCH